MSFFCVCVCVCVCVYVWCVLDSCQIYVIHGISECLLGTHTHLHSYDTDHKMITTMSGLDSSIRQSQIHDYYNQLVDYTLVRS